MVTVHNDATAQLAQGLQHHAGVVRVQQVVDHRGAFAQGREQQHAVGNALGAGQGDGARGTGEWGQVQKGDGVHGQTDVRAGRGSAKSVLSPMTARFQG